MKLEEALQFCNEEDKSTEFMIEFMQSYAKTDHDTVMKFLLEKSKE